ncbi:hypothetical protein HOLleu_07929 [Holothuria leucospilota]|uniref:Uncharacterized protein n=1 Tax=Holothuria leucospilota TaxID=206669 RepID=A0A9Q1HHF0_HOLLE|nr:hypothetical protein HOLleu_07929 [Holothuria leucospilota]
MLDESEVAIVKDAQRKVYSDEITALAKGNTVSKGSFLFKHAPVLCSDGVILIGGRLSKSDLAYDTKHPMVLPKVSQVAVLIAQDVHTAVGHL